jgi:hypothetical protein
MKSWENCKRRLSRTIVVPLPEPSFLERMGGISVLFFFVYYTPHLFEFCNPIATLQLCSVLLVSESRNNVVFEKLMVIGKWIASLVKVARP